MTLVVGRVAGHRISIAADTLLTGPGREPLPFQYGVIKSCMLPGDICVSFANSPETARDAFQKFVKDFPNGARYSDVVAFFESSSRGTGNEYLVAFANPARLAKIVDGNRIQSLSNTQWIGDQAAYTRFRGREMNQLPKAEQGQAINAVLFADDMPNSPGSDIFSLMRHVVADRSVPTAGGFVSVVTNFDNSFRFSVYSDMLFDWPIGAPANYELALSDALAFTATDENASFAIAQVSPGFIGANFVAYYFTRARKLFLFYGKENGLADQCKVFRDVPALAIHDTLNAFLNTDLKWLLLVTSPQSLGAYNPIPDIATSGAQFAFLTEASTFPRGGLPVDGIS